MPLNLRRKDEGEDAPFALGDDIQCSVTRSSRRKTIGINVRNSGVFVRAPVRMKRERIENFVRDNEAWIRRKVAEQEASVENVPTPIWLGGESVLYNGALLQVEPLLNRRHIERVGNTLLIPSQSQDAELKRAMHKWYKAQCNTVLEEECAHYAQLMQLQFRHLCIGGFKSRWGSCNEKNDLQFNWLLILVPERVRHYVIVHELAHTKILDHSPRYWCLVEQHWPNWKTERDWLRAHQGGLQQYL